MEKKFNFNLHNYDNCIVNLSNSVLKNFSVDPLSKTLPLIDEALSKNYKNIVVLILDGLGTSILEKNLPEDGFLRKHFVRTINTVFPPTTVAATTSVISGMEPIEHAWLGWDCYYPELNENVTVFLNLIQGTNKPVSEENAAMKYCAYKSVVDRINESGQKAYSVTPFVEPYPQSFEAICQNITELCAEKDRKYIYAYWNEPDSAMHEFGCYSEEAKKIALELEKQLEEMCETLNDTLLIVTADHGHVNGRNVLITDYPLICECLERMPSIEPRALNLFVKEEKKSQFEAEFTKEFGDDFILLTKEEIYREKLFGKGAPHKNVDGMIGDYVAVAVTDLTIFNTKEEADNIIGVHAGYTKDELEIPIIIVES